MAIKDWSTTAGDNNSASPDGFPEGMAPSGVNNAAREVMAQVRAWRDDMEWREWGHTTAYVAAGQFKTAGVDTTSVYLVDRRVRAVGATTGTIYGVITASAFSTDTTVDVTWDSGSLQNESLAISVGASPTGTFIPLATQTEMEAAADTDKMVVPGRQHYHPGHPKAWGLIAISGSTPSVSASYGLDGSTPVSDQAAGHIRIKLATAMSSANYAVVATPMAHGNYICVVAIQDADEFDIQLRDSTSGALTDNVAMAFTVFGDQ